jgi:metallo-beta-lactamase class B
MPQRAARALNGPGFTIVSIRPIAVAIGVLACSSPYGVGAQQAAGQQPTESPKDASHVARARALAQTDARAPFDFFCVPGNARPNDRAAPTLKPVQLFDNLYAVGNSETVVYALTTSAGVVLIDSGYPGEAETVVVPGLREIGLDPADVKFVLLGHGHSDHYGGAAFFQKRYGAHVASTAEDWQTIAGSAESPVPGQGSANAPAPSRDMVLADGEALAVGDTRITAIAVPGHTPGALAFVFPVFDRGTRHVAGLFGGTVLAASWVSTPKLRQYVDSIAHYLDVAERIGVDVEVQNHPLFDDTPARLAALAARRPSEPHPFVMGTDTYLRFWKVVSECTQADIARRADSE